MTVTIVPGARSAGAPATEVSESPHAAKTSTEAVNTPIVLDQRFIPESRCTLFTRRLQNGTSSEPTPPGTGDDVRSTVRAPAQID